MQVGTAHGLCSVNPTVCLLGLWVRLRIWTGKLEMSLAHVAEQEDQGLHSPKSESSSAIDESFEYFFLDFFNGIKHFTRHLDMGMALYMGP